MSARQAELFQALLREGGITVKPTGIQPRAHGDHPLMSVVQEQMWFIEQLSPGNSFYHLGPVRRLRGGLDVAALGRALTRLVARHDVLRTHYPQVEGRPRQVVLPSALHTPTVHDVAAESDPEAAVLRLVGEAMNRPFDLAKDQLLRTTVIRLADDDHVVVFSFQHIVADGPSLEVFLRELEVLYAAEVAGVEPDLPPLALQYADYAAWQREWLATEDAADQIAFWREQLVGAPELLDLPTDRPRPAVQSYVGSGYLHIESGDLATRLEEFARREGVSMFMVLLAGLKVLLAKYTGQTDIVVGTPSAGRGRPELADVIGCFFNVLPLRTDLSGDPTLRQALAEVRTTALEVYAHQDVPFQKVIEDLRPRRDLSHNQVLQVLLSAPWETTAHEETTFAGLASAPMGVPVEATVSDLMVYAWPNDDALLLHLVYATDLFDKPTVRRMAGHLVRVLDRLATAPDTCLSALDLLSPEERAQQLGDWNDAGPERSGATLVALWDAQVAATPDAVAVVAPTDEATFAEVDRRADAVAAALRAHGVGPESLVGVCLERTVDLVAVLFGVLKAGAAYVPLDPDYPAERLRHMVANSGVRRVVCSRALAERLPVFTDGVEPVLVEDIEPVAGPAPPAAVGPENLAYVIYTSGSAGQPKGVAVRHGGIANNLLDLNTRFAVNPGDRVLALSALSFDMSVYELIGMLVCGATAVLPEPGAERDPARWLELVQTHGVTVWNTVPARLAMLLDEVERAGADGTRLRLVLSGGDRLPVELPQRVWRAFGENVVVINMGGATEASIHSTLVPIEPEHLSRQALPYGAPMAGQRAYVVDGWGRLVPLGVTGELWLGGVGLARGYLGKPGLTAQRFVADPFGPPGARAYRTGDVARWRADGCLELVGRADHQVKVRGFRVELGEIEFVLNQVPGVEQAVVVAREDSLAAFVVGADVEGAALRAHCARTLPPYMTPQVFSVVDALPLTPNGKVDRKALSETTIASGGSSAAPSTPTEEIVAAVFADVLKLESVGADEDFFELGGHSLLATQAVARVRDVFDVDIPLRTIFERPTAAGFSGAIGDLPTPDGATVDRVAHDLLTEVD
jgi:amino acid adenylation domain-containing protein